MRTVFHIGARNLLQFFKDAMKLALPSPERDARRRKQRLERLARYLRRNTSYPYSSKRQSARLSRQNAWRNQQRSHLPSAFELHRGVTPPVWPKHLGEKRFAGREDVQ